MRPGWKITKLGDVCEIINGGTPDTTVLKYWDGENLWITPKDMGKLDDIYFYDTSRKITDDGLKNSSAKMLPINSIILSSRAPIGNLAINKKPVSTNQGCKGIVPKKNVSTLYLYYFLSKSVDLLNNLGSGATFKELSGSKLATVEIPLPSFSEQQHIVSILNETFTAIAKAKANAEQNLKNAKELFESYLQSVFANKGERWEEKTLGEIADVEYGYTDKSTEEGDYRYVRITDIDKNGELISRDKKYIKHTKEAENFLLEDNDLLMARTGATFAKVLLYKDFEPSVFASYLIRIKFKEKIINDLYWYFTKTKYYWDQANSLSSGAAQPHFNGAAVKQVIFSYPNSTNEQKGLIKKFETLSAEIKKLEAIYQQKLNDLEELKKSVLHKAFIGELKTK
jgi:type I restriction enzyme S subunit